MVTATINDREFLRALEHVGKSAGNLRPIFAAVRTDMRKDVFDHFNKRSGPDGAWARPSPKYVARVTNSAHKYTRGKRKGSLNKRGQKRLGALGGLGRLKSLGIYRFEIGRTSITMSLREKARWAEVHFTGGRVGKGARIPSRPALWASPYLQRRFREAVVRHVVGAWKR